MATLLAYYSSPALTQAERHLSRWIQRHAAAQKALETVEERAAQHYPLTGDIFDYQLVEQRAAYVEAEQHRVARYARTVAKAKSLLPAERANAYLLHVAREQAEAAPEPWLVRVVGDLVVKLITLLPVQRPQLAPLLA